MLHGHAKIELTNGSTGEKEVIEHDNLVTNALQYLVSEDPMGMWYFRSPDYPYGNGLFDGGFPILPIIQNSIGGVLCFADPLEENVNSIYADAANVITARSSNDVNPNANPVRGSMNLSESGKIEKGYRFVFDFTTSQGNGQISSIALTSRQGGKVGYGDNYNDGRRDDFIVLPGFSFYKSGNIDGLKCLQEYEYVYELSDGYAKTVLCPAPKTIELTKLYGFPFGTIPLNATLYPTGTKRETVTLTTTVFGSAFDKVRFYGNFCDGEDGFLYGFEATSNQFSGNSSGNATINWIKINKETNSFTEGTWTLPNVYLKGVGYRWLSTTAFQCSFIVQNGYVYFMAYDKKSIYKINTLDPTDILQINSNFEMTSTSGRYSSCANYFFKIGNIIRGRNYVLQCDKIERVANSASSNSYEDFQSAYPNFQQKIYSIMTNGTSSDQIGFCPVVASAYLATIFNLDQPVQKTADKTMKITYSITEATE
ncbi:MAG: hypothetical protein PHX61_10835 [Alphaproteobacteria bacterium]|nr:hypothetical protein [Alphaproteobacteria bacterium]